MNRDICILGGGALGSTIAYYLYRSGVSYIPVYYASEESYRKIRDEGGLYIIDKRINTEFLVPVEPRLEETSQRDCYFVFNTVKAYDVPKALKVIEKIAIPGGAVLMLQNGFGSLELAESILHGYKVAAGVAYIGAERISRNRVVYHGGNVILTGCRKSVCTELVELSSILRLGGLDLRITNDIDYYRWLKLALNAVVNPITALTRERNRVILRKEGRELAKLILKEVCEAAKLNGYILDEERLLSYVLRNVEIVAENVSSMAQDVIYGKKTEIDYINGYVASVLGNRGNVNKVLTILIKLVEKPTLSNNVN